MEKLLSAIATLSLTARVLYSGAGLLLVRGAFGILESKLPQHFAQGGGRYRARKIAAAAAYILILIFIATLFLDHTTHIGLRIDSLVLE